MNAKTEKLQNKLSDLKDKLYNENLRENQVLANRGWGHAMRCTKIGFSTRKSDVLKDRIKIVEMQLQSLNN